MRKKIWPQKRKSAPDPTPVNMLASPKISMPVAVCESLKNARMVPKIIDIQEAIKSARFLAKMSFGLTIITMNSMIKITATSEIICMM